MLTFGPYALEIFLGNAKPRRSAKIIPRRESKLL
jgi:hypothetical protein